MNNPTQQQMIALAQWWTSAIYGTPIRSNGDTSPTGAIASIFQTMIAIDDLKESSESTFREVILKGITENPRDQLRVDYHPQGKALVEAAKAAKLSDFALPPKIYSWFDSNMGQYRGVNGYGAATEVIQ